MLLSGLANCAGQDLPRAAGAEAQGAELLDRAGRRQGRQPQEATFYLRGKKIGSDAKPPIRIGLHHASSGEKLEAVASSLDGRKVSLTRKLRGC